MQFDLKTENIIFFFCFQTEFSRCTEDCVTSLDCKLYRSLEAQWARDSLKGTFGTTIDFRTVKSKLWL